MLTAIRTQFDAIHQTISGIAAVEKVPLPARPEIVVDYKHLLTLERKHVQSFIPEGLEDPVDVWQLLDGVDAERATRPDNFDLFEDALESLARMRERSVKGKNNPSFIMPEQSNPVTQNFYGNVASVGNQGTQTNVAGVVQGDQIGVQHNYAAEKPDLAAAAREIQQLLEQLSQTYPTSTLPEQMTVATKAVETIESQPTLKTRIVGALKAGGTAALQTAIDHPAASVLLAAMAGWQNAKG